MATEIEDRTGFPSETQQPLSPREADYKARNIALHKRLVKYERGERSTMFKIILSVLGVAIGVAIYALLQVGHC